MSLRRSTPYFIISTSPAMAVLGPEMRDQVSLQESISHAIELLEANGYTVTKG